MGDFIPRGTVFPSEEAQVLYPIDKYPCRRCETERLPHLVDSSNEFYWEHQFEGSARVECDRFGETIGYHQPRKGTCTPTYYKKWRHDPAYRAKYRLPKEYE